MRASTAAGTEREPVNVGESLAVLRHRGFAYFLVGSIVNLLGSSMAGIALAFAVLDLTGSASDLGIVLGAYSTPMVLLLLLGGVVGDRFPRHAVLVATNAVAGLTQAFAAALLISGHATIWNLVVLEAINGAASAFSFPAMHSVMPQIVPAGQLQQANALMALTRNVIRIAGPAIGGVVVVTVGSGWAIAVDGLSFGLAAGLFARMRLGRSDRIEASNLLHELREGWGEFVARSWVWVIVAAFGLLNAIQAGVLFTLGPAIADSSIGRAAWGLVLGAEAAGAVLGTLWLIRVRLTYPLRAGMMGMFLTAPLMLVLGLSPQFVLLVALALAAGIGSEFFGIGWETSLQQHIPGDRLSRVSSYDALGSFVAIPLGLVAAGPLANALGTRNVIVTAAIVYAALTVATLAVPSVWNLTGAHGQVAESAPEMLDTTHETATEA